MVELCCRHGFHGVEFKHELPFILPDRWSPALVRRIAKVQREEGLWISVHGPYTNIGSLLPHRWQAAVDEHLRALEWAEEMEAKTYTVHPGWVEKKYADPDLLARCRENTIQALARMVEHGGQVAIGVENQNPAEGKRPSVGSPCPSSMGSSMG